MDTQLRAIRNQTHIYRSGTSRTEHLKNSMRFSHQSVLARNKEQDNFQNGKPVSSSTIKIWQKSRKVCTGKNQLLEKRGIRQRKGELSPQKQIFKYPAK